MIPTNSFEAVSLGDTEDLTDPVDDRLAGAVSAPDEMVAVNGLPVRIPTGQRPPVASGRGYIEDHARIYYLECLSG